MGRFDGIARAFHTAPTTVARCAGEPAEVSGDAPLRDFLQNTPMGRSVKVVAGVAPLLARRTEATRSIAFLASNSTEFTAMARQFLSELGGHPAHGLSLAALSCTGALLRTFYSSGSLAKLAAALGGKRGSSAHPARAVGLANLARVFAHRHAAIIRRTLPVRASPQTPTAGSLALPPRATPAGTALAPERQLPAEEPRAAQRPEKPSAGVGGAAGARRATPAGTTLATERHLPAEPPRVAPGPLMPAAGEGGAAGALLASERQVTCEAPAGSETRPSLERGAQEALTAAARPTTEERPRVDRMTPPRGLAAGAMPPRASARGALAGEATSPWLPAQTGAALERTAAPLPRLSAPLPRKVLACEAPHESPLPEWDVDLSD